MRIGAHRLFDGLSTRGPSVVEIDGGSIVAVSEPLRPDDGPSFGDCDRVVPLLSPGFIDLQVNGWDDCDVAALSPGTLETLGAALARLGTTSFLATLTTARPQVLAERLAAADGALADSASGAVGIHLEGPFLGSRHGAHPSSAVENFGDRTARWIEDLPETVRVVTLGCESPEAPGAISALLRRGIVASLGHTSPDEAAFSRAVGAGASLVTHLYNAMSGVHHRDDGLAAMALTTDSMTVTLIADGVHVGRRAATIAFRSKPPGTIALVSDAVAWSAPRLREAGATVGDDRAVRLADGTLAGAATCIADGVRRLVRRWELGLDEVLRAATATPARVLALTDRGLIEPGLRADLVGLDDDLNVVDVWTGGRPVRA